MYIYIYTGKNHGHTNMSFFACMLCIISCVIQCVLFFRKLIYYNRVNSSITIHCLQPRGLHQRRLRYPCVFSPEDHTHISTYCLMRFDVSSICASDSSITTHFGVASRLQFIYCSQSITIRVYYNYNYSVIDE